MQSRVYKVLEVHVEALMGIPENPPAFAVSAKGQVSTTGWTNPTLAPVMYIVPPADGILDMDFQATAPNGNVLPMISPISVTQAFPVPRWVKGFRIHSAANAMEAPLDGRSIEALQAMGEGLPLPWPFPWSQEDMTRASKLQRK